MQCIKNIHFSLPVMGANIIIICLAGHLGSMIFTDFQLMKKQDQAVKLLVEENWKMSLPVQEKSGYSLNALTNVIRSGEPDSSEQHSDPRFAVAAALPDDALLLQAPAGELPVVIKGLLSSENRQQGVAIVEFAGQQKSYRPGEQLDNGAVIVRIFTDRVIFSVDGFYVSQRMQQIEF